jgi:glutamate decarboxylase
MSNLTRVADYLSDSLEALGFIIMSKKSGEGLPLVAFRLPPQEDRHYDEFALAHQLRVRGWVVPAYTMAPHTKNMKMLRVVVREDFTKNRCDALIADIKLSQQLLEQMDRESIKQQQEFIHKHHTASGKSTHNHPKYRVRSSPSVIVFFLRPLSLGRKELQYADRMFCRVTERETLAARENWQDSCCLLRRRR